MCKCFLVVQKDAFPANGFVSANTQLPKSWKMSRSLKTNDPESCAAALEEHESPSYIQGFSFVPIGLSFAHLVEWDLHEVQSTEHL